MLTNQYLVFSTAPGFQNGQKTIADKLVMQYKASRARKATLTTNYVDYTVERHSGGLMVGWPIADVCSPLKMADYGTV